jgi:hypothetical protein
MLGRLYLLPRISAPRSARTTPPRATTLPVTRARGSRATSAPKVHTSPRTVPATVTLPPTEITSPCVCPVIRTGRPTRRPEGDSRDSPFKARLSRCLPELNSTRMGRRLQLRGVPPARSSSPKAMRVLPSAVSISSRPGCST